MSPKFTKRHYKVLATFMRRSHWSIGSNQMRNIQWEMMRDYLADFLEGDNPHFNRAKFIEACNP